MASNIRLIDYAPDVSAREAWDLLKSEPSARLIDVRTAAEWHYVGLPDLSSLGSEPILVEWQRYPTMQTNPAFVADVVQGGRVESKDAPLLFLCRSGARSRSAMIEMTAAGHGRAFNIAGGFEGDLDHERHRGNKNGWKASGLPWKQS